MTQRRRRPKRTRASSDVHRRRGLAAGAAVAALLVVALLSTGGRAALEPRGRPALPHAELECRACHVEPPAVLGALSAGAPAPVASACTGCHGEHASRRPAHRELASRGELTCGACHAVHDSEDGVRFASGAPIVHYGTGFERELAERSPSGLGATLFVPFVARERCAACHDPSAGADPASSCFSPANPDYALCFDEHRAPGSVRRGPARGRDVATDAARAVALSGAARSSSGSAAHSALALGVSLVFAFAVVLAVRTRPSQARAANPSSLPLPANGTRRLPQIDPLRCLGCHACVDACPYDVLEVERYVARVARPDDCCGLVTCERVCPNGSLSVLEGPAPGVARAPRLRETLELRARPGIYVAGDASGSSLIRNAVRQGASVACDVARELDASVRPARASEIVDLAIVGAGPAGLSAGLEAQARGLSVVVIEQATIAESIRRFSREKLVLDADSESEERLPLFVGETHKEGLLVRWLRSVRRAGLEVREGERVVALRGEKDAFLVEREGTRAAIAARRVLIAVGRRGTPCKLEARIPELAEARVHYELSDAQAFAGQRVVVVGLGDVAMEAALALAAQPGTHVSVLHRGDGFRRGKRRNIDALSALVARGRVRLEFESEIVAVGLRFLDVKVRDSRRSLAYDALFVLIGALPATDLLEAFGVPPARD